MVHCLTVDLLEKSGKQHAIYPKLLAVNRTLNPLQNLLVLRLSADGSSDLDCIGLPAQFLALLDDEPDIIGVDIADERLDLVSLRN